MYVLESQHEHFVGFHVYTLFSKTCNDEALFSSSSSRGRISAPKFDTPVSVPNNVVLMFLEARWTPLLKL